jgi:galactosamine-6-phosphate isomerase
MKIIRLNSNEALGREAASLILGQLDKKKNALLCAATGGSPTVTYSMLKQTYDRNPGLFSELRIIKLDEWGGVPMDTPFNCECYIQDHLTGPLQIGSDRYISFQSNPKNPEEECERIRKELIKSGPIDICILGLGMNGHLALNEPGEFLEAGPHVARLSESSLTHPMVLGMINKPTYGLTLGMADIFQSSQILLLISGAKKKAITEELFKKKISTGLPASFLWLHPNAVCLIDEDAYPG